MIINNMLCLTLFFALISLSLTIASADEEAESTETEFSIALFMYQATGGVVRRPDAAVAIATAILNNLYGEKLLDGQPPLQAEDMPSYWLVTGQGNDQGDLRDIRVLVRVRKSDAAIIDLNVGSSMWIPGNIRDYLRDALQNKTERPDK